MADAQVYPAGVNEDSSRSRSPSGYFPPHHHRSLPPVELPMMLLSPVNAPRQWVVVLLVYVVTMNFCDGSERRRSPIVLAIAKARPAVVNIHGHKTIRAEGTASTSTKQREVNGMGTVVIVDERGYIVTNYHVVEGVRQINVTMSGGEA